MFEEKGLHLTDRRKGKAAKLVAAHALLNGRMEAEITDLSVLKYVAPRDLDDFDKVAAILFEEIKTKEKILADLAEIEANLRRIEPEIRRAGILSPRLIDYYKILKELESKIRIVASDFEDEDVLNKASELLGLVSELLEAVTVKLNM
jgi:MoxR-like ATPase